MDDSATLKRDLSRCPAADVDRDDHNMTSPVIKQEPVGLASIKQEDKYQSVALEWSDSVKTETSHKSEDARMCSDYTRMYSETLEKKEVVFFKSKIEIFDNYLENSNDNRESQLTMTDSSFRQPHKCSVCEKSFTKSESLEKHFQTHSGSKTHKCTVCEKTFTQRYLKKHLLIHSGIKPHKCVICQKRFSRTSILTDHLITHSDKRRYSCEICKMAFKLPSTLRQHKLTHDSVKHHKCTICEKTFTQTSNLKRHLLRHSAILPNKCSICEKTFKQSSYFKQHLLICSGKQKPVLLV